MAVSVQNGELVIDGGVNTEADLAPYVTVSGNAYKFSGSVRLQNNALLWLRNVMFEVGGTNIVVEPGSVLQLGELVNDTPANGCMLYAPNLKLAYGFGNDVMVNKRTQSGAFRAYGSRIDAPCFWGFFGPSSAVDLVGCSVNGFGRATGFGSRVKNVTFDAANGRYGILAPYGEFDEFSGVSVATTTLNNGRGCGLYLNPTFVTEVTVRDCVVNASEFVYCEPGSAVLNFIDGAVKSKECYFSPGSSCQIVMKRTITVAIPRPAMIRFYDTSGAVAAEHHHLGGVSTVEVEYARITNSGVVDMAGVRYEFDGVVDFLPLSDIMVITDRRGGPVLIT